MQPRATPPLQPRLQARADKLAGRLAAANRRVYRDALARHAAAFGATAPRHVRHQDVLQAIAQRAQQSARSITQTEAERRLALYQQTGSVPQARAQYREWTAGRADMIGRHEAGMAAQAAATDFYERNRDVLRGTKRVEPEDSAGLDDTCDDLIALGDVDLSEDTDDLPAHPNCPHTWQVSYSLDSSEDAVDDPDQLWVGGASRDGDTKGKSLAMGIDYFGAELELKTVSIPQRLIAGYAAHHHSIDRVRDIIDPAASAKAVARIKSPSEVACFIGHNSASLPVGIPQRIEATPQGLYTETYILKGPAGDNLLAVAKDLLDHGQSLGMSIGYKTHDSTMEHTVHGRVRRLLDYALKEYSFASRAAIANPNALVHSVKSTATSRKGVGVQYRVQQEGDQWLVYCDADADGDADDNRLVGSYDSAEMANAVVVALRQEQDQDDQDDEDDGDDDEAAGKTAGREIEVKKVWSQSMINDLPDSAFLIVEDGGKKDEDNRTVPRSLRHFPVRGPDGALDLPHLRNAIARIPQSDLPADVKDRLQARARRMLQSAGSGDGGDGKTYTEPAEWQTGAPPSVFGLGCRLQDLAEQLATELKAMALLGEETKGYQRMRPQMRDALRAVATDLGRLVDFAETIDRGEDGRQRLAWYRQQLALTEV